MVTQSRLTAEYFRQEDVVFLARDLLGKVLYTNFKGELTAAMITETEAYAGTRDRASHAFGGRRTDRTRTMYQNGGIAYIYLCYGVHSLFNIVTNKEGIPDAVLIRGIFPLEGIEIMNKRLGKEEKRIKMGSGPGKVSRIMGLHYSLSGMPVTENDLWLERGNIVIPGNDVWVGPRVGVDYAGEDARRPYRFLIIDPERII